MLNLTLAECEDGWRVVPPRWRLSDHGSMVTGVLCGARTPKLMERFERAAGRPVFGTGVTHRLPGHHPHARFQRGNSDRAGAARGRSLPAGRADGFAFTSAAHWFAEGIEPRAIAQPEVKIGT